MEIIDHDQHLQVHNRPEDWFASHHWHQVITANRVFYHFLAESRPLFHHLPQESALFLSGYGSRFSPAYLGNWIKGLMKRCGIDKPGSCHLWRHSCATDMHRGGA